MVGSLIEQEFTGGLAVVRMWVFTVVRTVACYWPWPLFSRFPHFHQGEAEQINLTWATFRR